MRSFAAGFRKILEDDEFIRVVGEASNGVEAIQKAQDLKPKVVVMDLSMPELDGVQATKEILKHVPETAVLVLSMHADDNYVRNALDAGARGYLLQTPLTWIWSAPSKPSRKAAATWVPG